MSNRLHLLRHITLFAACFLAASEGVGSSYQWKLIAKKGGEGTLTNPQGPYPDGFAFNVSLNNLGNVSFIGSRGTGLGDRTMYFGGVNGNFPLFGPGRVSAWNQVNDSGAVVGQVTTTGGGNVVTSIRTWQLGNNFSVDSKNLAEGGFRNGKFLTYDVVFAPVINNRGDVVFVTTGSPQNAATTKLIFWNKQTGAFTELVDLPKGSVPLRPSLSDNQRVVVRLGESQSSPIVLYFAGSSAVQSKVLASTNDFESLGQFPVISADGEIVVFSGNITEGKAAALNKRQNPDATDYHPVQPGKGIFAVLNLADPAPVIQKLAAINAVDGREVNMDKKGRFTDFEIDGQLAINSAKLAHGHDTVVFHASAEYKKDDGQVVKRTGVYSTRLLFFPDRAVQSGLVRKGAATYAEKVLEIGDKSPVAGFANPVDAVEFGKSVNNAGAIALVISCGADEAIAVATPRGSLGADLVDFDPDAPMPALVNHIVPAPRYSERPNGSVSQIVLHALAGTVEGSARTLTESQASIHYMVSKRGTVTQMVKEEHVANHAANPNASGASQGLSNGQSIGIELEDGPLVYKRDAAGNFVYDSNGDKIKIGAHQANETWATSALLQRASQLVRDIAERVKNQGLGEIPLIHVTAGPSGPFETTVTLTSGSPDGYKPGTPGIISHGQVWNRTSAKTDPEKFDWHGFMTRVHRGFAVVLRGPGSFLVTNPSGKRTGIDPATGKIIKEGSAQEQFHQDADLMSFWVPDAGSGDYLVGLTTSLQNITASTDPLRIYISDRQGGLIKQAPPKDYLLRHAVVPLAAALHSKSHSPAPGTISFKISLTSEITTSRVTGPSNLPPSAGDDWAATLPDTAVTIDVAVNDQDADGTLDLATIQMRSQPLNGRLTAAALPGSLVYTPNAGFTGEDQFSYTLKDNAGLESAIAIVRVVVGEVSSAEPHGDADEADAAGGGTDAGPLLMATREERNLILNIVGQTGATYELQYSDDMTNWKTLNTFTASQATTRLIEPIDLLRSTRFYRAVAR